MSYRGTKLPYHQQDGLEYCGPAVAQMMLDSLGAGLLSQDLLNAGPAPCAPGAPFNGPEALRDILNAHKPAACARTFAVRYDVDRIAGCLRIARTLLVTGIAVPVVIWGDTHWVAVSGAMIDGGHVAQAPATVRGFFINDPRPPTPSRAGAEYGAPPPHAPGDGCGSGDRRGSADVYVTAYGWQHFYWGTPYDAVRPPAYVSIVNEPPAGVSDAWSEQWELLSVTGAAGAGADEARRIVELGIEAHGLTREGPLACFLAGARPTTVTGPSEYHLVDLERGGNLVGHAAVDGKAGQLVSVAAPSSQTPAATGAYYRAVCATIRR